MYLTCRHYQALGKDVHFSCEEKLGTQSTKMKMKAAEKVGGE